MSRLRSTRTTPLSEDIAFPSTRTPGDRISSRPGNGGARLRLFAGSLLSFGALVLSGCDASTPEPTDLEPQTARGAPAAGQIDDLTVEKSTVDAITVEWSQVDDGSRKEAWYELRYAPEPLTWAEATPVESGPCASPVRGNQHGATVTCAVEDLDAATTYEFQVAAFRRGDGADGSTARLSNVATGTTTDADGSDGSDGGSDGEEEGDSEDDGSDDTSAGTCASPQESWIWCDDFEEDRLDQYFEYVDHDGDFVRAEGVGVDGSVGMRARWRDKGQVNAGNLKLAFGRTPQSYFEPVDEGTSDYGEVYWRIFVKNEADWTGGGGDKFSRGTIFASSTSWAQAMIAHAWSGSPPDEDHLFLDPASGTDEDGNVVTRQYNDFENLQWLGSVRGETPVFDADHVGRWYCVEVRVRLNDPGAANGEFQLWIDGELDAERTGLDWVSEYDDYGINAVFLENYWNDGAPKAQERYFDDFVVSTEPIGCTTS